MGVLAQRSWVMMAYRMPREPSTPRIVVWKRLRRLGVAQPVDGLVLLPQMPSTQEGLEWIAEQVLAADGQVTLWTAAHVSPADETATVAAMNAAVAAEYTALAAEANTLAVEANALTAEADVPGARVDAPPADVAQSRGATEAKTGMPADRAALRRAPARLGRALAQVQARDYFGAAGRAEAERAVLALGSLLRARDRETAR